VRLFARADEASVIDSSELLLRECVALRAVVIDVLFFRPPPACVPACWFPACCAAGVGAAAEMLRLLQGN
jgi:hypothetical protein